MTRCLRGGVYDVGADRLAHGDVVARRGQVWRAYFFCFFRTYFSFAYSVLLA